MWSVLIVRHDGRRGRGLQFGARFRRPFTVRPAAGPTREEEVESARAAEAAAWERDRLRWIDPEPGDEDSGSEITDLRTPRAGLERMTVRDAPVRDRAIEPTWPVNRGHGWRWE